MMKIVSNTNVASPIPEKNFIKKSFINSVTNLMESQKYTGCNTPPLITLHTQFGKVEGKIFGIG